jgi:hypothetical protein
MAFNLYAQGVAFFQSAQTLIIGDQPAEALLSLRGLGLIAAHFEQINDPDGPGLGIALRLLLDSIDTTKSGDLGAEQAQMVRQVADQRGIAIPETVPDPANTAVYKSLSSEMRLADMASDGGYSVAGLHIRSEGAEIGFHTKRQPDAFTTMVASASVIAAIRLLKHASAVFSWSLDTAKADELIAMATEANETATQEHFAPTFQQPNQTV